MKASNVLPSSLAIPTQAQDLKTTKAALTKYFKSVLVSNAEIKELFRQIDNLEFSVDDVKPLTRSWFCGKKFDDVRVRVEGTLTEYVKLSKRNLRKSFLGY